MLDSAVYSRCHRNVGLICQQQVERFVQFLHKNSIYRSVENSSPGHTCNSNPKANSESHSVSGIGNKATTVTDSAVATSPSEDCDDKNLQSGKEILLKTDRDVTAKCENVNEKPTRHTGDDLKSSPPPSVPSVISKRFSSTTHTPHG